MNEEKISLEEIEEAFEKYFPKGEEVSQPRGKALVLLSYFKVYLSQMNDCQRCNVCLVHKFKEKKR